MAETIKVLGQAAPAATTETALYTVPASTSAVSSTITVTNRSSSKVNYRIAIVPGGGATANENYYSYDVEIDGNSTDAHTIGLTLAATDVVRVEASTADLSFGLYGTEIT